MVGEDGRSPARQLQDRRTRSKMRTSRSPTIPRLTQGAVSEDDAGENGDEEEEHVLLNTDDDDDENGDMATSCTEQLLGRLTDVGCSPQTLEQIVSLGVSLLDLVEICKANDGQSTLENELLIDKGLVRARITGRIQDWQLELNVQSQILKTPNSHLSSQRQPIFRTH